MGLTQREGKVVYALEEWRKVLDGGVDVAWLLGAKIQEEMIEEERECMWCLGI